MNDALFDAGSDVCCGVDNSLPFEGSSLSGNSPWLRLLTKDNLELHRKYMLM